MPVRVLVVDHDAASRERIAAALAARPPGEGPAEVVAVGTGEEAIRLAASEAFDLVLADLVLERPGISGAHALRRIRERRPQAQTILLSEHACIRDLVGGVAHLFVVKEGSTASAAEGSDHLPCLVQRAGELLAGTAAGPSPPAALPPAFLPAGELGEARAPEFLPPTVGLPRAPAGSPPVNASAIQSSAGGLVGGKYELQDEVGRGAMGIVYRARDRFIGRRVAVKLLHLGPGFDVEFLRARMRREITIAGGLSHPSIVTIHDAGLDASQIYVVMELIEGDTLARRIRARGRMPVSEAVDVALQVLDALLYAHQRDVVHRDLKPANILVAGDGRVKVADFGLAKLLSLASSGVRRLPPSGGALDPRATMPGDMVGTPGYMAPEQLAGQEADARADLYAVGCVLYEMLDGRPLCETVRPEWVLAAVHTGQAPPPLPPLPGGRRLARVLGRALAWNREDRFRGAGEFAEELRAAAGGGWRGLLRGGGGRT